MLPSLPGWQPRAIWLIHCRPDFAVAFEDEKGKDDLIFDPLPPSKWIMVTNDGLRLEVAYSEKLSRLLRSMPGAKWMAAEKCWHVPFRAVGAVRKALPEIEALADVAAAVRAEERKQHEEWRRERTALKALSHPRLREAHPPPRPFKREYLLPTGLPCHVVTIEAIGDDMAREFRHLGWKSRNWVAQIFGSDGRGGWVRSFVSGNRDYSSANSKGSRGIMVSYLLEQGPIYEIKAPLTWSSSDRYFARIMDNTLSRMTADEVIECLEK